MIRGQPFFAVQNAKVKKQVKNVLLPMILMFAAFVMIGYSLPRGRRGGQGGSH